MYEGGVRVPFIARWPGKIEKGITRNEIALTMDLLPTILQAVGSKPASQEVDGKSIIPLLMNQSYNRKQTLHWENIYNMAVQKGEWKLVHQFWEKEPHLYNIAQDMFELNDVAQQHPAVVKELMAEHEQWLKARYPNALPRLLERPEHRIPSKENNI